ncbi:MAG: UDP-N-acetylmuramoyl-L-alanyl-D-glutamate--2,6-diaminopimelate ligase, partial [Bacteroidetes bacterium SW_10_40_5]
MEALTDILIGIDHHVLKGDTGLEVANLVFDSRNVQKNDAFVAVKGTHLDGHTFIQQAIEKGARAIILEEAPQELDDQVGYVQVDDSANALGIMAHNFYHQPSHQLSLVGVTGTNGKTTTAYLLYNLFTNLAYQAGLISTINTKYNGKQIDASLTTPDPVTINATLSDMVNHNVSHVFMEVSSHALDQDRVAGLNFTGGIF